MDAEVALEGYYGTNETFYAFFVESSQGDRIIDGGNPAAFLTTISRVDCEDNDELEVRGSITNSDPSYRIRITEPGGQILGENVVPDAFDVGVGSAGFRFRDKDFTLTCPSTVTATTNCTGSTDGSSFTFSV